MNKIFSILIVFSLIEYSTALGQDISIKYPDLIKKVNRINHDKTLFVKSIYSCIVIGDNEEIIGHYKNKQIRKITFRKYSSGSIMVFDYYFDLGKLIFVYETLESYISDKSNGLNDCQKTETTFVGRYYFKDNKLVDLERIGHNRFENEEFDIASILLSEMKEHLDKLNSRRR